MLASSFYAVLLLAAATASAAVTGFQNSTDIETLPACGTPDETTTALDAEATDSSASLTDAVGTTAAVVSSTSSAILAATTSASVVIQVVEVEVISFFVFVVNLGGALPPSVLKSNGAGNFLVFEEEFVELAPACSRACNHQFNLCSSSAGLAHATFAVADCQNQESQCIGVATTQSSTASTPATLKATATVVHAKKSAKAEKTTAAAASAGTSAPTVINTAVASTTKAVDAATDTQVAAADVDHAAAGAANACTPTTATITNVVYQCTAATERTVTVTMTVTAAASPGVAARRADRRVRRDASNLE